MHFILLCSDYKESLSFKWIINEGWAAPNHWHQVSSCTKRIRTRETACMTNANFTEHRLHWRACWRVYIVQILSSCKCWAYGCSAVDRVISHITAGDITWRWHLTEQSKIRCNFSFHHCLIMLKRNYVVDWASIVITGLVYKAMSSRSICWYVRLNTQPFFLLPVKKLFIIN